MGPFLHKAWKCPAHNNNPIKEIRLLGKTKKEKSPTQISPNKNKRKLQGLSSK
jgi:hypothetical protein